MKTEFLTEEIWPMIKLLSKKSKSTKIAVAYFGSGASKLINFKRDDILLVAMTIGNVKAGQVNPHEIEILYKMGVHIYSMVNLHSKVFLFDNYLIVGSSNASFNSEIKLVEAAILTTNTNSIRGANEFFKLNCVEQVDQTYISLCKKQYSPPKAIPYIAKDIQKRGFKGQFSPLWVLSTAPMKEDYHPDDIKLFNKRLPTFERELKNKNKYEVDKICYPISHRVISKIKAGDIFIKIHSQNNRSYVCEPTRVLGVIKNTKTKKAQLLYEEKKISKTKQWKPLEIILRKNKISGIKKVSSRRIENENTKKLLLNISVSLKQ